MTVNQADHLCAQNGPIESRLIHLLNSGTIQDLVALPEPVFGVALERIKRRHLERIGYVYIDEDNPAGCPTCEG